MTAEAAEERPDNGLTKVTVNLTPLAVRAMEAINQRTGHSKTDVINRALQIYALIDDLIERGGGALTVVDADGQRERIYIV